MREHRREIAASTLRAFKCTAAERDVILFPVLRKAPGPSSAGPAYCVGGIRLCKRAAQSALMIGFSRQARIRKARCDARRLGYARESPRFGEVYSFLWHVYAHVAEARPDEPLAVGDDGVAKEVRAFLDTSAECGTPFGPDFSAAHTASGQFPRRALPPGCPKDYYYFYVAEARSSPSAAGDPRPAAYTTFRRVWKAHIQKILTSRSFEEHGGCSTCSKLRGQIQSAPNTAAKQIRRRELDKHLAR